MYSYTQAAICASCVWVLRSLLCFSLFRCSVLRFIQNTEALALLMWSDTYMDTCRGIVGMRLAQPASSPGLDILSYDTRL